jgi:hypothetical protein
VAAQVWEPAVFEAFQELLGLAQVLTLLQEARFPPQVELALLLLSAQLRVQVGQVQS